MAYAADPITRHNQTQSSQHSYELKSNSQTYCGKRHIRYRRDRTSLKAMGRLDSELASQPEPRGYRGPQVSDPDLRLYMRTTQII